MQQYSLIFNPMYTQPTQIKTKEVKENQKKHPSYT